MAYISNVYVPPRAYSQMMVSELTMSRAPAQSLEHDHTVSVNAKTRLYIMHVGEIILDKFGFGRDTCPTEFYCKNILPHRRDAPCCLDGVKMTWNRKPGFPMCPCSPGYVLD